MFKKIVCAVSCGALLALAACGEQEQAKPAAQKVEKKADTVAQKADAAAQKAASSSLSLFLLLEPTPKPPSEISLEAESIFSMNVDMTG